MLAGIFEGNGMYDNKDIDILEKIMQVEDGGSVYGKTGTGTEGEAWFVGFAKLDDRNAYFAIYLNDVHNRDRVSAAKEIATGILK